MARSDHRRYLKRTFPDFITPTTAICRSRYVRRCNATTDEDVSFYLTETWRILSTKDTQDTSVPPRGRRANEFPKIFPFLGSEEEKRNRPT